MGALWRGGFDSKVVTFTCQRWFLDEALGFLLHVHRPTAVSMSKTTGACCSSFVRYSNRSSLNYMCKFTSAHTETRPIIKKISFYMMYSVEVRATIFSYSIEYATRWFSRSNGKD